MTLLIQRTKNVLNRSWEKVSINVNEKMYKLAMRIFFAYSYMNINNQLIYKLEYRILWI